MKLAGCPHTNVHIRPGLAVGLLSLLISPPMLNFSAQPVRFVPDDAARGWLAASLADLRRRLGPPATVPHIITDLPARVPKPTDLDSAFDFMCAIQEQIGQGEVEFALVELEESRPPVPAGFEPLGDPEGQLLHTFQRDQELLVLLAPAIFRLPQLVLASIARELGRIAIHRAGGHGDIEPADYEAHAELAAVTLGMGVWVANGSYVFENACCGGGCGIDLRSIRAGLSLPEACYALALDAASKGLSRRLVGRRLDSTQRAALKDNWKHRQREIKQLSASGRDPLPAVLSDQGIGSSSST